MFSRNLTALGAVLLLACGIPAASSAQPPQHDTGTKSGAAPRFIPEDHRPPLFFREDFKNEPVEKPVTEASLVGKNLQPGLYGPGKEMVEKSHHDSPKDDPSYIWLGACTRPCAFTLREKENNVDLTGLAKVRWRTKQTGFHQLRLILKLADGTFLVSDHFEGATTDWHETEFSIADVRWRRLDTTLLNDGAWVDKPDLTRVEEVGWTDLAAGSGSGTGPANGSSRVDWIEVYGQPVKR